MHARMLAFFQKTATLQRPFQDPDAEYCALDVRRLLFQFIFHLLSDHDAVPFRAVSHIEIVRIF